MLIEFIDKLHITYTIILYIFNAKLKKLKLPQRIYLYVDGYDIVLQ